jgi:paraquat-inducible protein B
MSPIGIGFGLLFGATAVGDQRRRRAALLRQQARGVVRQYLDDVQFQSAEQLAEMLRGVHRTLRDETSQRLAELQQTTAAAQARIEAGRRDDQATRAQRRKELDAQLAALQQWREMATRWQS